MDQQRTEWQDPDEVAEAWEFWCGETPWSRSLRRFGELGGRVRWFGGYPRSRSAIPLCFCLYGPDGRELPSRSRLKDIKAAVATLEERRRRDQAQDDN
jgi:hypothetical protein